jgi:hypothetical protein
VRSLAAKVGADPADCWPILQHLAANRSQVVGSHAHDPERATFRKR